MKFIYNNKLYIERDDLLTIIPSEYLLFVLSNSVMVADFVEISDSECIDELNSIDYFLDYGEIKTLSDDEVNKKLTKLLSDITKESKKFLFCEMNQDCFDYQKIGKLRHMYNDLDKYVNNQKAYEDRFHKVFMYNESGKRLIEFLTRSINK